MHADHGRIGGVKPLYISQRLPLDLVARVASVKILLKRLVGLVCGHLLKKLFYLGHQAASIGPISINFSAILPLNWHNWHAGLCRQPENLFRTAMDKLCA